MPPSNGPDGVDSEKPLTLSPSSPEKQHSATNTNPFGPESSPAGRGAAAKSNSALSSSRNIQVPSQSQAGSAPQNARGKEAFGDALEVAGGGDPNVLVSNQTPVLNVDIRGPKQILVGREAIYRVRLQNQSDVPAEGIVASIRIPSGAEVVNTSASQGMVQPSQDGSSKGQLQWQVARLDRRANETLEIHLVPRESRPLELGVSWTLTPVASRAVVEVQ
jgi:uncharacterized repeat protein (TIGR01451 family)